LAELHPIVLHFHIALLAFSVFTTVIAFMLSILDKMDFFKKNLVLRVFRGKLAVQQETLVFFTDRFEFVAFLSLISGLLTLLVAAIAGFLDTSGRLGIANINIDNFLLGIEVAGKSEIIAFKVIWAIFGTFFFIYAGVIRIYFVNYRRERLHDQNILYQLIHIISQAVGYFILMIVAGTGAILVFGGTLISDVPIIEGFLPQGDGDLLPIVIVTAVVLLLLTIIAGFSRKLPETPKTIEKPEEEHEITLWPPALAFGTVFLALGIILVGQGQVLSGLAFLWIFLVLIIAFIFKEFYSQNLFKSKDSWIWLFLGSEVILFSMIIGTSFAMRIASGLTWPVPSTILNVPLTAVNTFILILSSFTMVKAVEGIQNGNQKRLRNFLFLTFLFGVIFLSIQVIEYLSLFHEGFTPATSLFGSTFYVQTGLHGAHVFFGILIVLFTTLKANQGGFSQENHTGVELVGLYWHFVDLVWIVLFTIVYLI
jgi:heme/copper-type cytochrome/quinol oxidase subunit 3